MGTQDLENYYRSSTEGQGYRDPRLRFPKEGVKGTQSEDMIRAKYLEWLQGAGENPLTWMEYMKASGHARPLNGWDFFKNLFTFGQPGNAQTEYLDALQAEADRYQARASRNYQAQRGIAREKILEY